MSAVRDVGVVGLGETDFYRRGSSPYAEQHLALLAVLAACEDAGLDVADVDGFVSYGHDRNEGTKLAAALGVRDLRWSSSVWGSGGGGLATAFGQAAAAITSGQASHVVVVRALAQGNSGRLSSAVSADFMNAHYRAAGIVSPAQNCALRTQRLFEHDGVPRTTMRALAQACYFHAQQNPRAQGRGTVLDDQTYEASRWIAEPYRLYDCSRENDGAGALLLTSLSRGRDLRVAPVPLVGVASSSPAGWGDTLENDPDYTSGGFGPVADRLWRSTGLGPEDVDVVQVYENFAGAAVAALIDHGFCSAEQAGEFLSLPNLVAPGGGLPVNTSGGNIAEGFVHGIGLAVEAVRQIRGDSANQVPGARTSLLIGGPLDVLVSSALFCAEELS